jgi:hypothetical protein
LEAFMAEVNQEVAANKPNKPAGAADIERCDDVADPATEYMEVRHSWLDPCNMCSTRVRACAVTLP